MTSFHRDKFIERKDRLCEIGNRLASARWHCPGPLVLGLLRFDKPDGRSSLTLCRLAVQRVRKGASHNHRQVAVRLVGYSSGKRLGQFTTWGLLICSSA